MARGELLDTDHIVSLLADVAAELDALHADGVIHDAVSPESIFVGGDGRAHLLPFDASPRASVAYYAPEQRHGLMSPASDQYALGVIAWELVTGRRRASRLAGSQVAALEEMELGPSHVLRAGLSPTVNAAIERATAATVSWRYETASAFVASLATAVHDAPRPRLVATAGPVQSRSTSRVDHDAPSTRFGLLVSRLTVGALAVGAVAAATIWGGPLTALLFGRAGAAGPPSRGVNWLGAKLDSSGSRGGPPGAASAANQSAGAAGTTAYVSVQVAGGTPQVSIDGRGLGTAPGIFPVQPGPHVVTVGQGGLRFSPAAITVNVAARDTASAQFSATP
jgi:hypothetical protein